MIRRREWGVDSIYSKRKSINIRHQLDNLSFISQKHYSLPISLDVYLT